MEESKVDGDGVDRELFQQEENGDEEDPDFE
jgi:hypothetical protein